MGDLKKLILGGLIISAVLIGLTTFYSELSSDYGGTVLSSDSFDDSKSKVLIYAQDFQSNLNRTTDPVGGAGDLLGGLAGYIDTFSKSTGILVDLTSALAEEAGMGIIPGWVIGFIGLIIAVIVLFGIFKAIFGRDA